MFLYTLGKYIKKCMPINFKSMKSKYFKKQGEIAFRLWMFSSAYEQLLAAPNKEKTLNLIGKMENFEQVVKANGTEEEHRDLKEMIEVLKAL